MKRIILISLCFIAMNSNALQNAPDLQGFWLICETESLCEEDEKSMYLMFTDSTVNYLFNMGGEIQSITQPMKYVHAKNKIIVSDEKRSEEWGILSINDDIIMLSFKDQENQYLHRIKE